MGLFRSENGAIPDFELLEKAFKRLSERVDTLESANRSLKLEWLELYEKVSRLMSRMAKRYAVEKASEPEQLPPQDDNADAGGLDSISARIHQRRTGHARIP